MLICIMGNLGAGKSTLGTAWGIRLAKQFTCELYGSGGFKNVDYTIIRGIEDLERARDGIMIIDETQNFANSRNWKFNQKVCRFIEKSRKKNLIIFYITQHIRKVDINIRDLTDYVMYVENRYDRKNKKNDIVFTIIDMFKNQVLRTYRLTKCEQYFKFFDTNYFPPNIWK